MIPVLSLLLLLPLLDARKITVINSCGSTVWPGMHTGVGDTPNQATGWELASKGTTEFEVSNTWTAGRIWARTGCTVQDGRFQCLTGACARGEGGSQECEVTNEPPSTLAEFTLADNGVDHYDVSLVDGFNVPMVIRPSDDSCVKPACETNINPLCPPVLRTGIDQAGQNLGCIAACNAGFGQEEFGNRACCSGAYNDPELCAICGVDYYSLFKDNCKTSYAYAYDEKSGTALFTCPSSGNQLPDYTIEFCPNGTDYVGTKEPGTQYIDATATCSNRATAALNGQTYPVGPSPTNVLTTGTLSVVETVATGLDGAAAVQTSTANPSPEPTGSETVTEQSSSQTIIDDPGFPTSTSPAFEPTSNTVTDSADVGAIETSQVAAPTSTGARGGNGRWRGGQYLKAIPEESCQRKRRLDQDRD